MNQDNQINEQIDEILSQAFLNDRQSEFLKYQFGVVASRIAKDSYAEGKRDGIEEVKK